MKRRHFINFDIAGFTYWDGAIVFSELKIGTLLRLEREMDNRYDAKAVALYYNDSKLGYVPRCSNSELSKFLEMGYAASFEARISRVSPDALPEDQISVVVHLLEHKS